MTRVQVAYVHSNTVGHNFYHSMMSLNMTDVMPNHISARSNSMGLVDARNNLTEYFLDKTDAQYLWWIDSDMGFAPDTPQRLMKHGLDVVGARTYGYSPIAPDGLGGFVTKPYLVAYDLIQRTDGFLHYTPIDDIDPYKTEAVTDKKSDFENDVEQEDEDEEDEYGQLIVWNKPHQNISSIRSNTSNTISNTTISNTTMDVSEDTGFPKSLVQVAATGTGCLLVSRNALNSVRNEFGDCWFDQVSYPSHEGKKPMRISEDLSFCYRLSAVGFPIYIDLDVRTNHMKTIWVGGK